MWMKAVVALVMAGASAGVQAQVQRTLINPSFETPTLVTRASNPPADSCWLPLADQNVPGWTTTSAAQAALVTPTDNMCSPLGLRPDAGDRAIEFWRTGFLNANSPDGSQHAEISAYNLGRLSQDVCLVNGETLFARFYHRARTSTSTDTASFNVDSTSNTLIEGRDTLAGVSTIMACGTGLLSVVGSCTSSALGGWQNYQGTFIWNGTTGIHSIGLNATGSTDGNLANGNLIDRVQIYPAPMVEFRPGTSGSEASASTLAPQIVMYGEVFGSPLPVTITVLPSSTATLGTDYTTPNGSNTFTVSIPVGIYDGGAGSLFNIGLQRLDDAVVEDNEVIQLSIQSASTYLISNPSTCGVTGVQASSFELTDNDVDLATSKTVDDSTPVEGGTVVFTVVFVNNTAQPTVGDTSLHDATATISVPMPTGFSSYEWTCTSVGSPAPACPAASGIGSINANVNFPAGTGGNRGGYLEYTITGILATTSCNEIQSTASIGGLPATLTEATATQAGFVSPPAHGTANNSASAGVDAPCVDVSIQINALAGVRSGENIDYTIVVTNAGPETIAGTIVTGTVDSQLVCPDSTSVACSNDNGACPTNLTLAVLKSGIYLGTLAATAPGNTLTLTYQCPAP